MRGRSLFVVSALVLAVGTLAGPTFAWADDLARCLALAAEPEDPQLPEFDGVPFGAIQHAEAIPACEAAMLEDPLDPAVQYALSRAMIEHDTGAGEAVYVEESMDLLIAAAGAGYPAAMTALGELLYNDGEATNAEIDRARGLFERAAKAGHQRAAEWVAFLNDQPWGDVPPLTIEDFAMPEIIGGIYYGKFEETRDFQLGLVIEQIGISLGLSTYLVHLGETLQQRWYCPLMLPPHTVARVRKIGALQRKDRLRDPLSDAFSGRPGGANELLGVLGDLFGPLLAEFEQRAREDMRAGGQPNVFGMIQDLDHRQEMGGLGLQQMKDAAQYDAVVFYEYYGCKSPQSVHFGEQLAEFARQWNRDL